MCSAIDTLPALLYWNSEAGLGWRLDNQEQQTAGDRKVSSFTCEFITHYNIHLTWKQQAKWEKWTIQSLLKEICQIKMDG